MRIAVIIIIALTTITARAADNISIIPKPSEVIETGTRYIFRPGITFYLDPAAELNAPYFAEVLNEAGIWAAISRSRTKADIIFELSGADRDKGTHPALDGSPENYTLTVTGDKKGYARVRAVSVTPAGLINSLQTLRQLTEVGSEGTTTIAGCTINDSPAFPWRAFMLDECRHFWGSFIVKTLLDEMARLKMNVFHWHLSDHQGWRIEIGKYPLLTEKGSKRSFTHPSMAIADWDAHFPQRTYYTQEEIKDVVEYAAIRGITVIPEIEMPGHSSAAAYAYPWLGSRSYKSDAPAIDGEILHVIDPKVYEFLCDVLDEIAPLFPSGITHIGGDEADFSLWAGDEPTVKFMEENDIPTYSDLQLWFINKINRHLTSQGRRMIGWNEITGDNIRGAAGIEENRSENLAPGTIVHFWDGDPVLIDKAIGKGYEVVNSHRFFTYLDYPYEVTPLEKCYSFNPVPDGIADVDRALIKGIGCQLWAEYVSNQTRLFYQVFPRIAAHAETAWTFQERKDYNDFLYRFRRLERTWKEKGFIEPQTHKYP